MLTSEWNAPPSFGDPRGIHTHVVLLFDEIDPTRTKATLSHLGWGVDDEWNELYDYFDRAWASVLKNFAKTMTDSR